ncbi:MAG: hypothetical protein MAG431_02330 [Chloroflexi bacterium]|nr:hypothetical protein [Chloroflexota bacterium]
MTLKNRQEATAWPTRLYLVGVDGKVVYRAGLGPFGFKPSELDGAIKEYLDRVTNIHLFIQ